MKRFAYIFSILLFSNLAAEIYQNQKVGIDNSGNGILIFSDSKADKIRSFSYKGVNDEWVDLGIISDPKVESVYPYLALNEISGFAVAVWITFDKDHQTNVLYGKIYNPITGWSSIIHQISDNNVSVIENSIQVSLNESRSKALITWNQKDKSNNNDIKIGAISVGLALGHWGDATIIS